jgi:hypothetical protein
MPILFLLGVSGQSPHIPKYERKSLSILGLVATIDRAETQVSGSGRLSGD